MTKRDAEWNYRLQGIAAALGELAGAHMEPDLAMMVLKSLGLSITELQAAGADPHDLQPLKETDPVRYALIDAALANRKREQKPKPRKAKVIKLDNFRASHKGSFMQHGFPLRGNAPRFVI